MTDSSDAAFRIASVRFRKLDIPMKKAFGIAGGAQDLARNVLVEVELASGVRGYGEAAPLPAFNGETQEAALSALAAAAPELVSEDVRAWRGLSERIRDRVVTARRESGYVLARRPDPIAEPSASAACALETAILDALTRALGTSLRVFFGGSEEELVTDVTITTGTVEEAATEARTFAAFRTLKIKVGGGDVDHDIRRVLAVRDARPDARLLLDANGGFSIAEAIHLAASLERSGASPALFEQPIAPGNWAGLAEVRAQTELPIAIDESVTTARDVIRAHTARAADAVNIKLMKSGPAQALDIALAARACGLLPMIGGMVEGRLAMGTSACLAAGIGGFAFVDLDTPIFLAEDPFEGGFVYDDGGSRLDLRAIERGHGCTPLR